MDLAPPPAGPAGPLGPTSPPARTGLPTAAWVAIGAGLLVVLGTIGVGGFTVAALSVAASDHKTTLKVLESVRVHTIDIDKELKSRAPSFDQKLGSGAPDFAKISTQMQAFGASITAAAATVNGDLTRMRAEGVRLRDRESSPQAVFSRKQYDSDRHRVELMIDAFESAGRWFGIVQGQADYLTKLFDALDSFQLAVARADRNDFAGALAAWPQVDSGLQAAVAAATGPNFPPQVREYTTNFQTYSADLKAVVQAVQAQDEAAYTTSSARAETDSKAIQTFDDTAFQAFEDNLLTPYQDRYDKDVKAAGFTLNS